MNFEWDIQKHHRNQLMRGFGFDIAALIFDGDTVEWPDDRRDYGELRMRALGEIGEALLHVVFTDRGDVRRIISARVASRKERDKWLGRK